MYLELYVVVLPFLTVSVVILLGEQSIQLPNELAAPDAVNPETPDAEYVILTLSAFL